MDTELNAAVYLTTLADALDEADRVGDAPDTPPTVILSDVLARQISARLRYIAARI